MCSVASIEVVDVPNGSILKSDENGCPYWETPDGEKIHFDLQGLLQEYHG
jgi:hypothetical protein